MDGCLHVIIKQSHAPPVLHHKHIPYGYVKTTMEDDATALSEPLLDEESDAEANLMANVPPLNAEDSLAGLTTAQISASLEIFGKNEILIPETLLYLLFLPSVYGGLCKCFSLCVILVCDTL